MKRIVAGVALALILAVGGGAMAGERTVTLSVDNLTCASCPFIVKTSVAAVDGVLQVDVSLDSKTATVTFDDTRTTVAAIAAASGDAGYPATLLGEGG